LKELLYCAVFADNRRLYAYSVSCLTAEKNYHFASCWWPPCQPRWY